MSTNKQHTLSLSSQDSGQVNTAVILDRQVDQVDLTLTTGPVRSGIITTHVATQFSSFSTRSTGVTRSPFLFIHEIARPHRSRRNFKREICYSVQRTGQKPNASIPWQQNAVIKERQPEMELGDSHVVDFDGRQGCYGRWRMRSVAAVAA